MKKTILIAIVLSILAFYAGMAIKQEAPMSELHDAVIDKIDSSKVVNLKSGYIIQVLDNNDEVIDEWQYKQQGVYDAYSEYLNIQNVAKFNFEQSNKEDVTKQTSLSFEQTGDLKLLPISEVYYKNKDLFYLDRAANSWAYQQKIDYTSLDLLMFNPEVLHRYGSLTESENRGQFVVFYYSIDPDYLTNKYPNILETCNLSFPYKFTDVTIKLVAYPDTKLPRRVYSIFFLENLDTHEKYKINIDTYFSENEKLPENETPEIPSNIMEYKNNN